MFEFETKVIGLDATVKGTFDIDDDERFPNAQWFEIDEVWINGVLVDHDDLNKHALEAIEKAAFEKAAEMNDEY